MTASRGESPESDPGQKQTLVFDQLNCPSPLIGFGMACVLRTNRSRESQYHAGHPAASLRRPRKHAFTSACRSGALGAAIQRDHAEGPAPAGP